MIVLVSLLVIEANVFGRIKIKSKKDVTFYDDLIDATRFALKADLDIDSPISCCIL